MKYVFRTQKGYMRTPCRQHQHYRESIPAPPVVLTQEEHDALQQRLAANYRQPQQREYYDPLPCVLRESDDEDA